VQRQKQKENEEKDVRSVSHFCRKRILRS